MLDCCSAALSSLANKRHRRPGAASIGLMAGQVAVGIGGAMGHSALVNRVLSRANIEVFLPVGLEIW